LTPLVAIFYGFTGLGIFKLSQEEIDEELKKLEEEIV
jgi:hypothetical protein